MNSMDNNRMNQNKHGKLFIQPFPAFKHSTNHTQVKGCVLRLDEAYLR